MAASTLKRRKVAVEDLRARKRPNLNDSTLEKSSRRLGKQPASREHKKTAQRKGPVTSANGSHPDTTSSGDEEELHDENNDSDDEQGNAEDTKNENRSARESHKIQKSLLIERRAAKQHADVLASAKLLWAGARRKNASKEDRTRDIAALMATVRGRVQDLVLKHDASRIVQTIVKYGSQKDRDEVAEELKGRYRELVQNKYSKFLVSKLVRACPQHRTAILAEFRGHVIRLLLHREASSVIADAYELYANAYERAFLLHDFYGKEVMLFCPALGKGAGADKDERAELKKGLAGALVGTDDGKRRRVLVAVKENIDLILNNSDKGAVSHAIFHHALWEYLSQVAEIDNEELQDKLRREIFEGCQELLAEMVHTKDGSRSVREFIARGTAKDRKQILKILKPHIERICKDDEAQLVLFTALDIVDDTKLTSKSVVGEITSRAAALYPTAQGRRSLLYLLVPRSLRHFTPSLCAQLAETDSIRLRTSKKDPALREGEIREAASGPLLALLSDMERTEELIRDPGGSLLITEIMLNAEGDKTMAMNSLLQLLRRPYPAMTNSSQHVIDVPHSCRVYKTLLQGGHYSQRDKRVERVLDSTYTPISFGSLWLDTLNRQETQAIGKGGGAFVIAALVELVTAEGTDNHRAILANCFDAQYMREIEEGQAKGKQVLLDAYASNIKHV